MPAITGETIIWNGQTVALTGSDRLQFNAAAGTPSLVNYGLIALSSLGYGVAVVGLSSAFHTSFVNAAGGVVNVNGINGVGYAVDLGQGGQLATSFTNNGAMSVYGEYLAIGVNSAFYGSYFPGTSYLQVVNSGEIHVSTGPSNSQNDGLALANAHVVNSGLIAVTGPNGYAVHDTMGNLELVNSGTLQGSVAGVRIDGGSGTSAVVSSSLIYNGGTITAPMAIDAGTSSQDNGGSDVVHNTGLLDGAVKLGKGSDVLDNAGTVTGAVSLGDGDDVYSGAQGTLGGVLSAGAGADMIIGGAGAEILFGGEGADIIAAGGGDDFVDGGGGADLLDGGDGFDTLSLAASNSPATINLATGVAGGGSTDAIRNFERVVGSALADSITGAGGAETLEGRDGADQMFGGAGADILIGGKGDDGLTGGTGDDTFLFASGDGHDTVNDFQAGGAEDSLSIYGYSAAQSITQQGADTLITLSGSDSILLKGVTAANLTASDIHYSATAYVAPAIPADAAGAASSVFANDFNLGAGESFSLNDGSTLAVGNGTGASFYNAGHVVLSNAALDAIDAYGQNFYNEAGGVIDITGGSGVYANNALFNAGSLNITVPASNNSAIRSNQLVNTGDIHLTATSGPASGLYVGGRLWNSGGIWISGDTAQVASVGGLVNSGEIHAVGSTTIGIQWTSAGAATIYNSGLIEAQVALRGDTPGNNTNTIYNSGEIRGKVLLANPQPSPYGAYDQVFNSGKITGLVDLADGNDLYDGRLGTELGGVQGGLGADTILAGAGSDSLDGGEGDDILSGGAGNDTLTGGAGNDHFRFEAGSGADVITDFTAGGTDDVIEVVGYGAYQSAVQQGADTLITFAAGNSLLLKNVQASALTSADFVYNAAAIAAAPAWPTAPAAPTAPTVPATPPLPAETGGTAGADTLDGTSGADFILGLAGGDHIAGHGGADQLAGGEGADTFIYASGDGADIIYDFNAAEGDVLRLEGVSSYTTSFSGADTIITVGAGSITLRGAVGAAGAVVLVPASGYAVSQGTAAGDSLNGSAGADILRGQDGADVLHGLAGADRLEGGLGNDTLEGGTGNDDLLGGMGADTFVVTGGDGADVIEDFNAAEGDVLVLKGWAGYTFSVPSGTNDLLLQSLNGAGSVRLLNTTFSQAELGITFTPTTTLAAAVSGSIRGELIDGTGGGDELRAKLGSDEIRGGAGADLIYGGDGDDLISGDTGNDDLYGGAGADSFVYHTGDGWDVIRDFNAAEGDLIRLDGLNYGQYTVSTNGPDTVITFTDGSGGGIFLPNAHYTEAGVLPVLAGLPLLNYVGSFPGGGGNDTLTGTFGMDVLAGFQGNDNLYGGGGDDLIAGGSGSDHLYGGDGSDILAGYGGNGESPVTAPEGSTDTLTGGLGRDYFVVFANDGADIVTDFDVTQDWVDVRRVTIQSITQVGADALISFGGANSLLLQNVAVSSLTLDNFVGALPLPPLRPALSPAQAAPSDFNLDGKSDVLWRNDSGELYVWNSQSGQGAFLGQTLGNPGTAWHVQAVGDYDGDGKADVLWRNNAGDLYVYRSDDGAAVSFTGQSISYVDPVWAIVPHAGDFDGDGRADILYRNSNTGEVYLWNSNLGSDVSFTGQSLGAIPANWHIQGVDDFNGDGKADILWRNDAGDVYVWTATGSDNNVGVAGQSISSVGNDWSILGAGDFNGDGRADILWRHAGDGELYVWNSQLGSNAVNFLGQSLGVVGLDWSVAAIGDYDGDGRADVLFRNADGRVYVWNSNDTGPVGFQGQGLGQTPTDWHILSDFHGM